MFLLIEAGEEGPRKKVLKSALDVRRTFLLVGQAI